MLQYSVSSSVFPAIIFPFWLSGSGFLRCYLCTRNTSVTLSEVGENHCCHMLVHWLGCVWISSEEAQSWIRECLGCNENSSALQEEGSSFLTLQYCFVTVQRRGRARENRVPLCPALHIPSFLAFKKVEKKNLLRFLLVSLWPFLAILHYIFPH